MKPVKSLPQFIEMLHTLLLCGEIIDRLSSYRQPFPIS